MASGSSGSNVLPWFLGICALGILTGGALTASEALVAEEAYQRDRDRAPRAARRVAAPRTASRIRGASRDLLKTPRSAGQRAAEAETVSLPVSLPAAPPGSVSPRPARVASPTAPPGAFDERLEGVLVGMGFKAAEARAAIAKLPPSASKVALGDQIKAALAQLSK